MVSFDRLEKDSSNDADMFEDSSGEETIEATCSVNHGGIQICIASTENSKADDAVGDVIPNSKALVSVRESPSFDEETLIMSNEEHDFFERYKEGKYFILFFISIDIIFLSIFSKTSRIGFIKVHHLFMPTLPCESQ